MLSLSGLPSADENFNVVGARDMEAQSRGTNRLHDLRPS
jgi:hypothetical protein